jgi:hypothetical protein
MVKDYEDTSTFGRYKRAWGDINLLQPTGYVMQQQV